MKVCDLSSGASKLANALKQLHLKWESARDTWADSRARAFEKESVEPLMPAVKETLDSLGRLAEVLDRAARDVSEHDGS